MLMAAGETSASIIRSASTTAIAMPSTADGFFGASASISLIIFAPSVSLRLWRSAAKSMCALTVSTSPRAAAARTRRTVR